MTKITARFQVDDVVTYADGCTALMQIKDFSIVGEHIRYYGEQYFGGAVGAYEYDCRPASVEQLDKWYRRLRCRIPGCSQRTNLAGSRCPECARSLHGTRLTFDQLREANVARCESRTFDHGLFDWSPTDWGCALAGEVGELCNKLKKIHRGDKVSPEKLREEFADIAIYLDLAAARMDIDLSEAVIEKFNKVSYEKNSELRLGGDS